MLLCPSEIMRLKKSVLNVCLGCCLKRAINSLNEMQDSFVKISTPDVEVREFS